jgi:2-polyprenyl-6-methoxyphenol hydroxylase-like FAD-dependent oxidoreductase
VIRRPNPEVEVVVVGAWPTGPVLALRSARLGTSVRIIDKAAQPGTASRAFGVQARTLEFYRQVGFADDVVRQAIPHGSLKVWLDRRLTATAI